MKDNHHGEPVFPGEILLEEFLNPMGMSQNRLAMLIQVPAHRIGEIVHNRRRITADTALRLAKFFGTTPEFWLNLQQAYDLKTASRELAAELSRIHEHEVEAVAV